ncbi:MAG TPA: iron-sulfur cluster repair di-iron protein [Acidimicrobiales bacterium]|nr:iron-sulfur cluster repair di-iron protein [Acidimicrobiales bacterium]
MTDVSVTLGDLVADDPGAARVLDRYGLDFCCHGDRTLHDACTEAGIDAADVEAALADAPTGGDASWTALDPPALADHIVTTHHRYLDDELPALVALADKVLTVHGARHPELADVSRLVVALVDDLVPHLRKEERVLFPAIHALAAGRRDLHFGPVENPIRMMGFEHERAGDLLAALRQATDGYRVPDDGCASYRSLYERLEALELDTHLHIHKENHVLFPAAIRLAEG